MFFGKKYSRLIKSWWFIAVFAVVLGAGVAAFVFVKPEKSTANLKKDVGACISQEVKDQLTCLNKEMDKIAKEHGVKVALDVIEPFSEEHTYLLEWAHEFSHTIGGSAIANYRHKDDVLEMQIGKALVECDGYGAFGCYHGVIEAGLAILPAEKRATVIRGACLENPLIQEKQYFINQCLHWFGHGVAIFSNLTLEEALAMCDGLNKAFYSDEVQLCLSGLFHSGAVPGDSDAALLHNVKNVWKKDEPYFPCLDIEEKFRGHCFSHAPGRTLSSDLELIFRVCDNIPESDPRKKLNYVWGCYDSASNILLPEVLKDINLSDEQKAEKIVSQCREFSSSEYRKFCYSGAARYWVLRDPLLTNLNPFNICKAAENSAKSMCYASIGFGNNENYYSPEKLAEYCNYSEPDHVKDCLSRNPTRDLQ